MEIVTKLPLHTVKGRSITEMELLSDEGSQGMVFKVRCGGAVKVLKVYRRLLSGNAQFRNNLRRNVDRDAPDPHFVWPEDLVDDILAKDENGSFHTFGYVMELFPQGFLSVAQILKGRTTLRLTDDYICCRGILRVCMAFQQLHIKGLSYQDISSKNILIDPRNGDVRIGDADNVAPDGIAFVEGTARYMAPEVVRDRRNKDRTYMANSSTDDYALAVLIFLLLFRAHPLEGQAFFKNPVMCEAVMDEYYGLHPCYVFDHLYNQSDYKPGGKRFGKYNGPLPLDDGGHSALYRMFLRAPKYLMDAFARSFSRGSLEGSRDGIADRTKDFEWVAIFLRMQAQMYRCPNCRQEVFERDENPNCPYCRAARPSAGRIRLGGASYTIPQLPGRMIARAQFGACKMAEKADPVLWLGTGADGAPRLQNVSGGSLKVFYLGQEASLPSQQTLKLVKGVRIAADNGEIELL